jgi:hypothetical protein
VSQTTRWPADHLRPVLDPERPRARPQWIVAARTDKLTRLRTRDDAIAWSELAGRASVLILDMASVLATRRNPMIPAFYQRLLGMQKPEKLALIACMHKMPTMLSAKARRQARWSPPGQPPTQLPGAPSQAFCRAVSGYQVYGQEHASDQPE